MSRGDRQTKYIIYDFSNTFIKILVFIDIEIKSLIIIIYDRLYYYLTPTLLTLLLYMLRTYHQHITYLYCGNHKICTNKRKNRKIKAFISSYTLTPFQEINILICIDPESFIQFI